MTDVDATPCTPSGALDLPDAQGADTDCDGIDGVEADSVFVSTSGNDNNAGTKLAPVRTIARGLAVAQTRGAHHVLLASGVYTEVVTLVNGISIHGGYAANWNRQALEASSLATTITATSSPVLIGASITAALRVTGVRVQAPDATSPSQSSISVIIVDSSALSFEDAALVGGTGAPGANGITPGAVPMSGVMGGPGSPPACMGELFEACPGRTWVPLDLQPTPASCGCGAGGAGLSWVNNATPGAGYGSVGTAESCAPATGSGPGSPGVNNANGEGGGGNAGAPGNPGLLGNPGVRGTFSANGYAPVTAGSGGPGGPGGGGGGGRPGGGGAFCSADGSVGGVTGGAGGDGGTGGCGGEGGTGASGGGVSVGCLIVRSAPVLLRVLLASGGAGDGGDGGMGVVGATGGPGGIAPPANANSTCPNNTSIVAYRGGNGGQGGQGGTGGRGGGGAGGISSALVLVEGSALAESSANVFTMNGAAGAGGEGGNPGAAGLSCASYDATTSECLSALP